MSHYDLIIIGSGPSGKAAAIQAGKLKRKVLVIDRKDRLGGVSGPYRHDPVEDPARDGAEPLGLA